MDPFAVKRIQQFFRTIELSIVRNFCDPGSLIDFTVYQYVQSLGRTLFVHIHERVKFIVDSVQAIYFSTENTGFFSSRKKGFADRQIFNCFQGRQFDTVYVDRYRGNFWSTRVNFT